VDDEDEGDDTSDGMEEDMVTGLWFRG